MNNPFLKLKNTLVYTTVETVCYQSMLALYQMYLYYALGTEQYGIIGICFSIIYVGAQYANMGLDVTLAPMLYAYKTKYAYIRSITHQIALQTLLGLIFVILFSVIPFEPTYITQKQLIFCFLIALSENAKKTLKTVLHLLLFHYHIACIETGYIIMYLSSIGVMMLLGWHLSFGVIMIPIFLLNLLAIGLYSIIMYYHWTNLPKEQDCIPKNTWYKHADLRIKGWIYQIVRSFYSPNFLVFFIAAYYTIEAAGMAKLISSLYTAINSMSRYIIVTSSSVLFSHTKKDIQETKSALQTAQRYTFLFSIGITCSIILITGILTSSNIILCILLLALLLSEQLSIMYESLLIVQEKILFLTACYIVSILGTMYLKYMLSNMIVYLYFGIIAIRCVYLITIYYYTYYVLHRTQNSLC